MTIKQQGGIFGRNPTFNKVDAETITGVSGVFTQDLGVGTNSPSAPFVASNNGAEGYEIAPATAVGGVVRAISFNRSTVAYVPFRQQASEHQFYNASSQIAKLTSTGNLEVNVGNLVIGTSGKGIDFSATSGTGTSELFDDYEEGTWTAQLGGSGANPTTPITSTGKYTKVGRKVTVTFDLSGDTTGGSGVPLVTGLPFTIGSGSNYYSSLVIVNLGAAAPSAYGAGGNTFFALVEQTTFNYVPFSAGAGRGIHGTFTYFV